MNDTHLVLFSLTLLGFILLFAIALHRKHDEWNEAVTKINQLESEVQRLRGARAGLETDNTWLAQRNAELETLLISPAPKPPAKAPAKKIVARKRSRKAVE